ncbi:MAG: helix-turn-helix transcriptional regulator [Asticcacaulis sp.]|uniref:winged helix-turn-helix transcriptional regulator n=1 Tax=Asticcacaulis sp. TaxID=1872648 RepID=UPI0025BFC227|nr:helix-turn-helix domain-containing protein [Asticcacaulis sp.]MCA1936462.1 helix-turn-helix transcriptional regulator [Asticcacaulis sp.]
MGRSADYSGERCAIAAAIDIVGEPWTLLIVRNAFLGHSRFEQWQKSLGVARNVLAARLKRLVALGLMQAVVYSERPLRHEYVLTEKGRSLKGVLVALYGWGRQHVYDDDDGPFFELVHDDCKGLFITQPQCEACGEMIGEHSVLKAREDGRGMTLSELYARKGIAVD